MGIDAGGPDPVSLARWATRLTPRAGTTRVLAIDGRSGSGKSQLADRVALALNLQAPDRPESGHDGHGAPVVRLDDTYPGWDGLEAGIDRIVVGLLQPLAAGLTGRLPGWDWALGIDGPSRAVRPAPVVLLEGVGAGALRCAPYLAGLVWLDVPAPVRRARALARDGAAYAPHWARWARQEAAYLARDNPRRRADLVLPGVVAGPPDPTTTREPTTRGTSVRRGEPPRTQQAR